MGTAGLEIAEMFELSATPLRHYHSPLFDSRRWEHFERRDDDILICTAYKSGTTWMQRICSLLIFQTPELDRKLSEITPWLDIHGDKLETMLATYAAQKHRRFIKTHTPLDGLPWHGKNMHLVVVRDPRDVIMSILAHFKNLNPETKAEFAVEGRKIGAPPPAFPEDPNEAFRNWLTQAVYPWEKDGFPIFSAFHHLETFWQHRDQPNIAFFHFTDMKADLDGQMRRVSALLGIPVDEARWPALVEAATFGAMKAQAAQYAPESHLDMWKDAGTFFNKGKSGQWRDVLSAENLALFDRHVAEHYPADMIDFMVNGNAAKFA